MLCNTLRKRPYRQLFGILRRTSQVIANDAEFTAYWGRRCFHSRRMPGSPPANRSAAVQWSNHRTFISPTRTCTVRKTTGSGKESTRDGQRHWVVTTQETIIHYLPAWQITAVTAAGDLRHNTQVTGVSCHTACHHPHSACGMWLLLIIHGHWPLYASILALS